MKIYVAGDSDATVGCYFLVISHYIHGWFVDVGRYIPTNIVDMKKFHDIALFKGEILSYEAFIALCHLHVWKCTDGIYAVSNTTNVVESSLDNG